MNPRRLFCSTLTAALIFTLVSPPPGTLAQPAPGTGTGDFEATTEPPTSTGDGRVQPTPEAEPEIPGPGAQQPIASPETEQRATLLLQALERFEEGARSDRIVDGGLIIGGGLLLGTLGVVGAHSDDFLVITISWPAAFGGLILAAWGLGVITSPSDEEMEVGRVIQLLDPSRRDLTTHLALGLFGDRVDTSRENIVDRAELWLQEEADSRRFSRYLSGGLTMGISALIGFKLIFSAELTPVLIGALIASMGIGYGTWAFVVESEAETAWSRYQTALQGGDSSDPGEDEAPGVSRIRWLITPVVSEDFSGVASTLLF